MRMKSGLVDLVCNVAAAPNGSEAGPACDALSDHLVRNPADLSRTDIPGLLSKLRSNRNFSAMCQLAETSLMLGSRDPVIRRQYGQALIDTGKPVAAIEVLKPLTRSSSRNSVERLEAIGLTGRACKDLYINGKLGNTPIGRSTLGSAISHYGTAYGEHRTIWHGINLASLLFRAERDGISLEASARSDTIAREILGIIDAKPEADRNPWDWAARAEACAVTGDWKEAQVAIRRFAETADGDAFMYAGTLRQLENVLDILHLDNPAATDMTNVLKGALLRVGDGRMEFAARDLTHASTASKDSYERILGTRGALTHTWIENMVRCGRSVGQIRRRVDNQGFGTCFIVRGRDIVEALGDELFLLTNEHVVSANSELNRDGHSLLRDQASVHFELLAQDHSNGQLAVNMEDVVWCSGRTNHDATLLRVTGLPSTAAHLPLASTLPVLSADDPQWVYAIGHPGGRSLSYSIQESKLLDYEGRSPGFGPAYKPARIHYTTPTEGGSSGSPVFNDNWDVIALHHAGAQYMPRPNGQPGTQPANQGIVMTSIQNAVRHSGVTPETTNLVWQ